MRRTKEEADITRQRLLQAALAVFSRQGYSDTRLEDIATEAEVTRGAIYHHFGSKAELYNQLVLHQSDKTMSLIHDAISQGGSVIDILRRIFILSMTTVEVDRDYRAVQELILFKTGITPELREGLEWKQEGIRGAVAFIGEQIQQGIDECVVRADVDPRDAALSFIALQNGLMMTWLLAPTVFSLKDRAAHLAELYVRGIAAA